jgi:hypothetical protein
MAEVFPSLSDITPKPETVPVYSSLATASPDIGVSSTSTGLKPLNPEYVPQQIRDLETELSKQGSKTSTLATILSIIAATKGDFRGLLQIEESKRRTALAKDIIPKMRVVNELVDTGDFKGAGKYLDAVTGSYGARAEQLEPYFRQMASNIKDRQKRYEEMKARLSYYDENVPKTHPSRSVIDSMKASLARGELPSQEGLNNVFNTLQPHIQQIDRDVMITSPVTGQTQITRLPEVTRATDLDTFAGHTIAGANNITVQQLADVLRGVTVKDGSGKVITPGSSDAQRIQNEYIAMGPIQAREKLARFLQLDPAITLQAIKEFGEVKTALRMFGADDERINRIENVLQGQADRLTQQKKAEIQATTESDISAPLSRNLITIEADTLRETQPATYETVRKSGGKLLHVREDVFDNIIQPSVRAKEDLQLIHQMFTGNITPSTKMDRLSEGINQIISSYLGYPVTKETEIRQGAKAILNSAVEQVENVIQYGRKEISGRDRKDIADLKAYVSGDFKTSAEYIQAARRVQGRLDRIINRSIGRAGVVPETSSSRRQIEVTDERGKPTPYSTGPIQLPPQVEQDYQRRLQESGQQQPEQQQPTPQKVPSAADRIRQGWGKGR